ncbi:hypothetical protein C3K47_19120 [Solitalea longa]|uniref:Lipoprotein n=1 Tax=Solitalea longa TaxID=2079460 RepID=A0A2S4ZWC1_9SPHI|nr:hypothetical protein [Solitalea longa]POY34661.1 hypothetical protein C3K47_19120 [Solitalea longa]
MKTLLLSLLVILVFTAANCRKQNDLEPNGLPPATQEGKNTLGFLLNGESWTPRGFNGTANLSLYYDPTFRGGVFNVSCYNRETGSSNRQLLGFFADSVQQGQKLQFGKKNFGVEFYDNYQINCDFSSSDKLVTAEGYCEITKIDKVNGIFSGKFEFTLKKENCKAIKITEGRFDLKF